MKPQPERLASEEVEFGARGGHGGEQARQNLKI